jgi:lysophospholipase
MRLTETDGNPAPPGSWVDEIITADGIRLRAAHWPAIDPTPRGTVLILQGRTEFIEKYFETVADLLKRGFAVVAFDWRSQGRSQRLAKGRCHVESFADYDRDLDAIMRQVVLPDCPQPLFALAHSMGALAALRAARDGRVRFDRMVLLAPMLELSRRSAPPMGVIRFLAAVGLLFGRDNRAVANRALRERYEPEEGYRQEKIEEVQRVAPDLQTGLPTARWVYVSARAMREAESTAFARAIKQPTLLVVAGRDRIVSNEAIERFAGDLRFAAQIIVAGARHEVLMEPDQVREQFWAAFDAFVPGGDPFAIASSVGEKR